MHDPALRPAQRDRRRGQARGRAGGRLGARGGRVEIEMRGHFVVGREFQRGAVHAVAKTRWRRTIGKDVAQMRVAIGATRLDPAHQPGAVLVLRDRIGHDGGKETRPARAGIEFRPRMKELGATAHAGIPAAPLLVPIGPSKGALGAVLARHMILLGRQLAPPFGIALCHLGALGNVGHVRLRGLAPNLCGGAAHASPDHADVT